MNDDEQFVRIGDRSYNVAAFPIYADPQYQEVVLAWQAIGYCKHSDTRDQMQWALIEALLFARHDEGLRWVETSGVDYPALPLVLEPARRLVALADEARRIVADFEPPPCSAEDPKRVRLARVATALEHHVARRLTEDDAHDIAEHAGDAYLCQCLENPTFDGPR
jgi:hypothetical protein